MNTDKQAMQMKDIQRVSLEILKFVTALCEKHNFRYALMYGTLIGAIRHQGYIPWDDDIDIMMPRPDYERFLAYCAEHKEELGVYEIFNRFTHADYIYGITRVSDSRYEIIKEETSENCGMGIFIDVYPYDGLGNDHEVALQLLSKTRHYCDTIVDMTRVNQSVPAALNWKGSIVYKWNRFVNKFRGVKYYLEATEKLRGNYQFDQSEYVGPLMWYFSKPHKVLFKRSFFDKLIKMPFEDGEFYVPSEYDALLRQAYGDYMQLPPVEKRIYQHQYAAYKK